MLEGVPYIFPPGGSRPTMRSGLGAVLGAPLGYNRLWLTLLLLHAFSLPIASLYEVGLPTAWLPSKQVLTTAPSHLPTGGPTDRVARGLHSRPPAPRDFQNTKGSC